MRALMVVIGTVTAWHSASIEAPLWITATFVGLAMMFLPVFTPPRAVWLVLNPAVALVYIAHALWLGLRAAGSLNA